MNDGITILYDGQCPFCSSYVSLIRLRDAVGPVELVDARSDDPRVAVATSARLDLDNGMVVMWEGRTFFGEDAVHLLATLSRPRGLMNRIQRRVFSTPRRAARVYPLLARGRKVFLRLVGRRPIGNSTEIGPPRQ
jgi:predicted DCC family thiol-disulfide oxidoreductase YuxK